MPFYEPLVELLVREAHEQALHEGMQSTLCDTTHQILDSGREMSSKNSN